MKILYAIQGTGNGHISRAMEIIPHLREHGELDILLSGSQVELRLEFPVKHSLKGLGFFFGKKGGIDYLRTALKNNLMRFLYEIQSFPIHEYDLVISDFEPVSAWAAYHRGVQCISLCNQCVTLHPRAPKPKHRDLLGEMILTYYAPGSVQYGYHYLKFDENIFTPVIRKKIRELEPDDKGHYTVYLPAYEDERILINLQQFPDAQWEVFSKKAKAAYRQKNVSVMPVSEDAFVKSLASCSGVLCAAGFGATTEALYLKKKLLVIPQKAQYEQQCNAEVLKSMGVHVMKSLKQKHAPALEHWLNSKAVVEVDYPDVTARMIETIVSRHAGHKAAL